MPDSKDQQDLKDLEAYFTEKIEEAFPKMSVKSYLSYDLEGDDFVGVFTEEDGPSYTFLLQKGEKSPVLKRVG